MSRKVQKKTQKVNLLEKSKARMVKMIPMLKDFQKAAILLAITDLKESKINENLKGLLMDDADITKEIDAAYMLITGL